MKHASPRSLGRLLTTAATLVVSAIPAYAVSVRGFIHGSIDDSVRVWRAPIGSRDTLYATTSSRGRWVILTENFLPYGILGEEYTVEIRVGSDSGKTRHVFAISHNNTLRIVPGNFAAIIREVIDNSGKSEQLCAFLRGATDTVDVDTNNTGWTHYYDAIPFRPRSQVSHGAQDTLVLEKLTADSVFRTVVPFTCDTSKLDAMLVADTVVFPQTRQARPRRDAGISRIIAPTDTVDSSAQSIPQAMIVNYGSLDLTGGDSVQMRIGPAYSSTQTIGPLAPGDSLVVGFASWTALTRGYNSVKCSTRATGDVNSANDAVTTSVFVRVRDLAADSIISPRGEHPVGQPIGVISRVFVSGNVPYDSAYVQDSILRAGSVVWAAEQWVGNLLPGQTRDVDFGFFTPTDTGEYVTRFRVHDGNPVNNTREATFTVHPDTVSVLEPRVERVETGSLQTMLRAYQPSALLDAIGREAYTVVGRRVDLSQQANRVPGVYVLRSSSTGPRRIVLIR